MNLDVWRCAKGPKTLAVADKVIFQNCLVAMRPQTHEKDLSSMHEANTYIYNKFVEW